MVASSLKDTIVAPATGDGATAVAIVRLSGPEARSIATKLAPPRRTRLSHRLYRIDIRAVDGELLDDAMVVEMHGPGSYTGEDVVEFHLHGAQTVVNAVLENCVVAGARLAEPGEFTLRAFLYGRIDLTQAEAIGDLIASGDRAQRRVATAHLAGSLGQVVGAMLNDIEGVLARWHALLDFPEQVGEGDVEETDWRTLNGVRTRAGALVAGARLDVRHRRHVVLCGAPNVGKSSLLNILVGERRVLVDALPGTTRDPVEVELALGSSRLSVWDTAGIRDEAIGLERDGVELTWDRVRRADVVVWLASVKDPVWPAEELRERAAVVGSKADLADEQERQQLEGEAQRLGWPFVGFVSAYSGEGVGAVSTWLAKRGPELGDDLAVVVRERHLEALQQACAALDRVMKGSSTLTLDVLSIELEGAAKQLGMILGREVDGEVLDRIFANFCLGK